MIQDNSVLDAIDVPWPAMVIRISLFSVSVLLLLSALWLARRPTAKKQTPAGLSLVPLRTPFPSPSAKRESL